VLINRGLTESEEQSHREGRLASFDNLDDILADSRADHAAAGEAASPWVRDQVGTAHR
jgi:hypothetical protein